MRLDDHLELLITENGYDEDMNPTELTTTIDIGKCKILPNTAASRVRGNDGNEYIYAYEIFVRNPARIIVEGDKVRFIKKDETIDKTMTVRGFVTLKKWEKIWV